MNKSNKMNKKKSKLIVSIIRFWMRSFLAYQNDVLRQILFFLLIFFLPTQFGKHFFLPFSYLSGVRVDYLAPTIYLTDIIVFILALLNWREVIRFFTRKKILFFLFLFLINVIFAQSAPLAFYRLIKIIEFVVLFVITKNITQSKEISPSSINRGVEMTKIFFFKLFLLSITITTLIQTLLVTLQFVYKQSVQGIFYFLGERYMTLSTPGIAKGSLNGVEILRPYGTFSHPNSLAGFYLLLYFFVLTYKAFRPYKILRQIFLILSTFLIFFSFSKTVIIAFVLLNLFYLLRNDFKLFHTCRICSFAKVLSMLALAFIFFSFQSDPLNLIKRLELLKNSFFIILQKPILGTGIGNYLLAQQTYPSHLAFFFQQPVHNIFVLFLVESGIIISIFFIWEVLNLVRNNIRKEVFFYTFLVILITGSLDHYWLSLEQNFLLLAVILGIII